MRRTASALLTAAACALSSAACAAPQSHAGARDPVYDTPNAERCFSVNEVARYHGDGDRGMFLRTRTGRYYRIGFVGSCPNAARKDADLTLVARGATSLICRPIDVQVVVSASDFPLSCAVSDIHPMSAGEVAALPPRLRP